MHTKNLEGKQKNPWINGILKGFQMDIFDESDTLVMQHRHTVQFARVDEALHDECRRLAVNIGDDIRVNMTTHCVEIIEKSV